MHPHSTYVLSFHPLSAFHPHPQVAVCIQHAVTANLNGVGSVALLGIEPAKVNIGFNEHNYCLNEVAISTV